MLNIAIVIPTYKRQKKLKRCLDSILSGTYKKFKIHVFCDNQDLETFEMLEYNYSKPPVIPVLNTAHRYVIGSWNHFTEHFYDDPEWDAMAWVVDDVELNRDCLEKAVEAMEKHYPDTDGVVGLAQECPGHPEYTYKPYGQVLLGKKFIGRYKNVNYKVCAPCYQHFFQDEEMHMFANSLGKFYHCKEAILKHYHPSFIKEELDDTHHIVRGNIMKEDRLIYNQRRALGLVWGKSWKVLNKGE